MLIPVQIQSDGEEVGNLKQLILYGVKGIGRLYRTRAACWALTDAGISRRSMNCSTSSPGRRPRSISCWRWRCAREKSI